ncbi:MAG TPA: tripartite tricarboxylate transporter substrate binding protein [Xanthobacteraceae bacterium]|nr:tripartite tricarboxylate transporter substrate binding protein [Xanthobacteraceae bacterium]
MNIVRRDVLRLAAGAAALSTIPRGPAGAQGYPDRAVRIVVPFSAGGPADTATRILGEKLSAAWGKPVVVENRAGAGGNIGAEFVARQTPDGYTLLVNASNHVINASLYKKLAFDPIKSFTPITELGSYALIWVVHPSVPATTLDEFVTLAKAQPGEVTVGDGGVGAPTQLCAYLFAQAAGVTFLHVPYKGGAPASAAVVAGHVKAMCNNAANALPQVRGGTLRALAVAGANRLTAMPELPTVAELGYPGFEASGWLGLFAPAHLPAEIAAKLHADTIRALKMPDVEEKLTAQGYGVAASTPEKFTGFLAAERDKWGKLVKSVGLKAD